MQLHSQKIRFAQSEMLQQIQESYELHVFCMERKEVIKWNVGRVAPVLN
jgi:hypothetical protein